MQVLKEIFLPSFEVGMTCLDIMDYAIKRLYVNKNILLDKKYDHLITVEAVNKLVRDGISFRDAYREIGRQVSEGEFKTDKNLEHTHDGSIGNLCLEEIRKKKESILDKFNFDKHRLALARLLDLS